MTKLAAYLFSCQSSAEQRGLVFTTLTEWLAAKGADDPESQAGAFESRSGSAGSFSRESAADATRTASVLRLREQDPHGNAFTTLCALIESPSTLTLYVCLSGEALQSTIAPQNFDPKCPRFLRNILHQRAPWTHGGLPIPTTWRGVADESSADQLIEQIRSESRTLPIVVVSELDGEPILTDLPATLARELLGLASVVSLSDKAAWRLTDALGQPWSCFRGAVRLYWPRLSINNDPRNHPLWTAARLLSNDHDQTAYLRFPAYLRRRIMAVSALSIAEPDVIAELFALKATREAQHLRSQARSAEELAALADQYARENDALRLANAKLAAEISRLREAQASALGGSVEPVEAFPASLSNPEQTRPKSGEIRYYKKTGSKGAVDTMVSITDCGHSTWQSATKADKAKKGLEKLEGTRDWKTIKHCGSCTGGGVYRVRW